MEGRPNSKLNQSDSRKAAVQLTSRVEGLAQQILDHIASGPEPAPVAARGHPHPVHRAVRGRAPSTAWQSPSPREHKPLHSMYVQYPLQM